MIADDLTGAADTVAPFARRGLASRLACSAEAASEQADVEALAVNAGTRVMPPARAASIAGRLVRKTSPVCDLLIKKIDSTLRGNVAAETIAALRSSGRRRLVLCPAVPSQGRTVRGGRVFVHGAPLEKTEFVRRERAAPSCLAVAEAVREAGFDWPVAIGPDAPGGAGRAIWIPDAAAQSDLARVADWVLADPGATLTVCAAGLATALAEQGRPVAEPPHVAEGPWLFVVGSRASASEAQVRGLLSRPGYARLDAPMGRILRNGAAAPSLNGLTGLVVQVPADPAAADPVAVARTLAADLVDLLPTIKPAAMLVTGGDTAAALFDRLGIAAIDVLGEACPGLALLGIPQAWGYMHVVTKAGGFGDPDLMATLPTALRQRNGASAANTGSDR